MKYFVNASIKTAALAVIVAIASIPAQGSADVRLFPSPGDKVIAEISDVSGVLAYKLSLGTDRLVIERSRLGVTVDGVDLGLGVRLGANIESRFIDSTSPTRGVHALARDHCQELVIPIESIEGGKSWRLQARVYDDGLAFRYVAPSGGPLTVFGEATSFKVPAGAAVHYQTTTRHYEGLYQKDDAGAVSGDLGMPAIFELPGGGYIAINEAANYGYSGMTLKADRGVYEAAFLDDDSWEVEPKNGVVASPWRVIIVVDNLTDLVNSDIIHNVSPPPDPVLFADAHEWIKPGRGLWSWWAEGTGGPELQRKYVDAAAELGYEYILVDDGWRFWLGWGKTKWDLIEELVDYADERGVRVWVWRYWQGLGNDRKRDRFLGKVAKAGVVGVKIDFMDSESQSRLGFYENLLRDAARHKLMVNFHGANKPTGESRTWPNEMTREGVRGLEYNKFGDKLLPSYNATIPFTRFVAGHGDYTPVTFNPKKLGETTYAHQVATAIVFTSPVLHLAEQPEFILDNPDAEPALDVLKAMPSVWDQTIVLPGSAIGECAAFARRRGEDWFIGVVNGERQRTLEIDLEFLGAGKFKAVILADDKFNPAALHRSEQSVGSSDKLIADMASGGGYVVMLKRQ